mmetsp:Transcript_28480/g.54323  ORF Transcript_28480/g.54323 Transcript_28480/m.54323 type:complete len:293 (-) Transcript_28480:2312-3190(-)
MICTAKYFARAHHQPSVPLHVRVTDTLTKSVERTRRAREAKERNGLKLGQHIVESQRGCVSISRLVNRHQKGIACHQDEYVIVSSRNYLKDFMIRWLYGSMHFCSTNAARIGGVSKWIEDLGFQAACSAVFLGLTVLTTSNAALASVPPDRLSGCSAKTSCVSTSALSSPSQYLPPWDYAGLSRDQAYSGLRSKVISRGGELIEEEPGRYLKAWIPFGKEKDLVEFLFATGDNIILFRASSAVNLPDPPGCFGFGCINGPRNRGHMNELRDSLDFLTFETDEDKVWVPLLFH